MENFTEDILKDIQESIQKLKENPEEADKYQHKEEILEKQKRLINLDKEIVDYDFFETIDLQSRYEDRYEDIYENKREKNNYENNYENISLKFNEDNFREYKEEPNFDEIVEDDTEDIKKENVFEEEIKENIEQEDFKENNKEQTIEIGKKEFKHKGLIIVFLLGVLSIFCVFAIKNLPKNEKKNAEQLKLADTNNINIQDISEENQDEAFTKENENSNETEENKVEENTIEDNKTIEENNINSNYSNYQNTDSNTTDNSNANQKDIEEIDKALAELDSNNSNNQYQETRRSNNNEAIAFIRKENQKSSNEKSNTNNTNTRNDNTRSNSLNYYNEVDEQDIYRRNRNYLRDRETRYELKQGEIIPAILVTEVNTDLPGVVLAQVREDIYDTVSGDYLLIPKGSKLYGKYSSNVANNQSRVIIVWEKLTLPDGSYVELSNMIGTDMVGNSGLKDRVDNHTLSLIGNAVLSSILNFGNNLSKSININIGDKQFDLSGNEKKEKDNNSSFEKATGDILQRSVDRSPTITIRKGLKFNIIVNADIELKPYKYNK